MNNQILGIVSALLVLAPIGPARITDTASDHRDSVSAPTTVAISTPPMSWHRDTTDRAQDTAKQVRPGDWCDKRERANRPGMTMSRVPRAKVC